MKFLIRASEVALEAMPLLQPENVGKISGKLLVESVVAPVGRRVPEDYSPNLVGFRDSMKPEPAYWIVFCVWTIPQINPVVF